MDSGLSGRLDVDGFPSLQLFCTKAAKLNADAVCTAHRRPFKILTARDGLMMID